MLRSDSQSRLCSRAARAPTEGVSRLTREGHLFDLRPDAEESASEIDLPLHDGEPESVVEPATSSGTSTPIGLVAVVAEDSPRSRGGAVAVAMLVIGLFVGGAGGFMAGQRMAPPNPGRAAEVSSPTSSRTPPPSTDIATIPDEPPIATQDYTKVEPVSPAAAPPAPKPVSAAPPPSKPASPASIAPPARQTNQTAAAAAPARPAAQAVVPATIQFASRPGGAVVYVNDRRVGTTPFTMRDVSPGTHRVRMELADHQPWTTTVTVKPGADVRVGASLE